MQGSDHSPRTATVLLIMGRPIYQFLLLTAVYFISFFSSLEKGLWKTRNEMQEKKENKHKWKQKENLSANEHK